MGDSNIRYSNWEVSVVGCSIVRGSMCCLLASTPPVTYMTTTYPAKKKPTRTKLDDYYEHVARPGPPYENASVEFATFGFASLQRQKRATYGYPSADGPSRRYSEAPASGKAISNNYATVQKQAGNVNVPRDYATLKREMIRSVHDDARPDDRRCYAALKRDRFRTANSGALTLGERLFEEFPPPPPPITDFPSRSNGAAIARSSDSNGSSDSGVSSDGAEIRGILKKT